MMKFKNTRKVAFVFILAVSLLLITRFADGAGDKLADKRYVDPKGYFKIVPPADWRVQEYPQDIRGKVAFIASNPNNTELRVLVNASDFTTIDDLIKFCKNAEQRISISTNIEKSTFGGRPAVKRSFEAKGLKFMMYDFLVESVYHNLQFSAPQDAYDKFLSIVTKSMETYEPVIKTSSDQDVIQHGLARKRRLAELMIDMGNYDIALEHVKEGLELSPHDSELLKLKTEAEKRGRTR